MQHQQNPYGQQPGYGQPHQGQQPYGQPYQQPPQQQQQHAMQHTPQGGNPRLQEALGQIDLLAGEQIVYTLQADGFFLGANPLLKLMAAIQAFMVAITGGYIRIFLVVTNQRVLVLKNFQMWCGCGKVRGVHAIALAGVKEVGSSKETQMCFIHTRTVQMQSMTQTFNLVVKKLPDQEIRNFVTNLSAVVVAHTARASV
jgi:hypothetical protein